MRKEAALEQWKELYEVATRIKELKPWEKFWDLDLIGIRDGEEEDMTFFSILGRGDTCYGVVVYEGFDGLNDFMMLTMQEQLNLPVEYVMYSANNLTCYWGNREELSDKQRKVIKDLGYKYRGKNQWLYFMSFQKGYYPYNLDEDEVLRMTEHFRNLETALLCYEKFSGKVDFENGDMFYLEFGKDKSQFSFGAQPLPFTSFQFGNLILEDKELIEDLKRVPQCKAVLEADVSVLGSSVSDKKYDRPANPGVCMMADASAEMILCCDLQEPEDDMIVALANRMIDFIFQYGAPKEIRVSNILVEAGLEHICEICKIKLRRVKRLSVLSDFLEGMQIYMRR